MDRTLTTGAVALLVAFVAACQDTAGPGPRTLDDLVGNYVATEAVYTSASDATLRRDVLAGGGAYTLQIHPGGQFTTTLERPGATHIVRSGTLELSGNRLTVTEWGGAPRMVEFSLSGDVLTWNDVADRYDFGQGETTSRFQATLTR